MISARHFAETSPRVGLAALVLFSLLHGSAPAAQGGTTTRVSVDSAGVQGNDSSYGPSISADGRFVAFVSLAPNLVPGDGNGADDVFVRDRWTAQTSRVSVDSAGMEGDYGSYGPSISSDGRCVAFNSDASNLVAGDANGATDVFVHDRETGQTTRVSVDSAGIEGNGQSGWASISGDGRYVAFSGYASNLVLRDTNGRDDVFVHDRQTGETTRVSIDSAGQEGNDTSYAPSLGFDGRFVAFGSQASNLVGGDLNGKPDMFVHDRATGQTTRVSVDSAGNEGNDTSSFGSITSDGRWVTFGSFATNLVVGDTNGWHDVFVHDRQTGQTTRASVDSAGNQGNERSGNPSIAPNGRYVGFESLATNLVAGDTNGASDSFVHDMQTGQTTRVSVDSQGNQGNGTSVRASMSSDGRYTAFSSKAGNLVPGDTNNLWDVFVRDRQDCAASAYVYCTAKTTSSGCTPAISFSGVPSATAFSGFTVSASQVEAGKPGMLFYGTSGPQALPFQGGLLCVRPPIQRTPPQSSGSAGSPPCAGILSLDLNAAGICASIGTGYQGWMQGWFRDPASPSTTGLTDAVGFTVCP